MDVYNITRLKLFAPIERCQSPFSESISFFTLDEAVGTNIDPDPAGYLGEQGNQLDQIEIPAGDYFFAQQREALGREAVITMAIEVQREILWQRLQPEPGLYLRRLYEDGSPVTQVFRTYKKGA
ncbi:MAG: hypothetical protein LBN21_10960 [Treponema sp.]|jgi:hypothetical protein|nr:hypothetical protein [Treponema sp.]